MVRVLHIDDDLTMRKLMKHYLSSWGYEHLEAPDAETGMTVAITERPDIIIVDRILPGMDGVNFCRIMRIDPATRHIPVIMLSAISKSEFDDFDLLSIDYITKPYTPDSLLLRIRKQLALKQFRDKLDIVLHLDSGVGIPGNKTFNEYYSREWRRAVRTGRELSVVIIDIDHFQSYIREFGRDSGEKSLKSVAELIRQNLKRPADFLAKYDEKQFIVILPDTILDGAYHLAELIRRDVENLAIPHTFSPSSSVVTVSVGVACSTPTRNDDSGLLLSHGRFSLLKAKTEGRNRVLKYPFENLSGS